MHNVLVLAAHRTPDRSRINRTVINRLSSLKNITIHELIREYPDFRIDVEYEHRLLSVHQTVVLLFPFYWYSAPAILKEWQDAVLTPGFAYAGGTALKGKHLLVATSTGAGPEAYSAEGINKHSVEALLLPIENMAHRTGMIWHKPQLIQNVDNLDDGALAVETDNLITRLSQLSADVN